MIAGVLEFRLQSAALDLLAVASLPQRLAFVLLLISREQKSKMPSKMPGIIAGIIAGQHNCSCG